MNIYHMRQVIINAILAKERGEGIKYQIADGTFRVHFSERMTLSRELMTGVGAIIISAAINKHKHPEVGTCF